MLISLETLEEQKTNPTRRCWWHKKGNTFQLIKSWVCHIVRMSNDNNECKLEVPVHQIVSWSNYEDELNNDNNEGVVVKHWSHASVIMLGALWWKLWNCTCVDFVGFSWLLLTGITPSKKPLSLELQRIGSKAGLSKQLSKYSTCVKLRTAVHSMWNRKYVSVENWTLT